MGLGGRVSFAERLKLSDPANKRMNTTETTPPGSLQRMVRRRSMCIECPFRPPIENAIDMAGLLNVEFTCHMEDSPHVMGDSRVQCRGHWEAVRKYKRKSPNGGTQRRRDENAPPATETQSRRSLE